MEKNKYNKMKPQIDSLCEKLNLELDNFPAGTRFYSLRQLQEKYKYHRGIIDRTLKRMEQQELIRRVPRIGIFSNVTRKQLARKVLFLYPDWPSNMIQEWAAAATRYVEQRQEWLWQKRSIDPDLPLSITCAPEDADAMILFCPSCNISCRDMTWMASQKLPIVLLNADTGSFELSSVLSDDRTGAGLVSSYLFDRGHRRVAVVYSEPHTIISENRIDCLLSTMKLLKMVPVLIDSNTVSGEYSPQNAYTAMKEHLALNDNRANFTAVYSITGDCVPEIMTALREHGYRVPEDISIISMTTEKIGRFNHPPLTAACNDLEREVEITFEGIEELLSKKRTSFKASVPMRLIERKSVQNIIHTSQLQNYFARFCVVPALLPPRSAFERSAATPEALQNGKITQAADKIIAKR